MVFLHFPSGHTDEELMLKAKYAKLKKKKKALQNYQNPKPEPEKLSIKRPLEPKDAKEYAKKLIMSGKISVPKQLLTPKTQFKKPQGLIRKLSETRAAAVVGPMVNPNGGSFPLGSGITGVSSGINYKPFTPSTETFTSGFSTGSARIPRNTNSSTLHSEDSGGTGPEPIPGSSGRGDRNFGNNRRNFSGSGGGGHQGSGPRQGNTIYVKGTGLTEHICQQTFGHCGNILSISMEIEKNCGFITFDKIQAAEKAISELNNATVGNMKLIVSFARRQLPVAEMINDSPAAPIWAMSAQQPHRSSHKDKRNIQVYDTDI